MLKVTQLLNVKLDKHLIDENPSIMTEMTSSNNLVNENQLLSRGYIFQDQTKSKVVSEI